MINNVFTEEFFNSLKSSVVDIEFAESLPPQCYSSQAFFERDYQVHS